MKNYLFLVILLIISCKTLNKDYFPGEYNNVQIFGDMKIVSDLTIEKVEEMSGYSILLEVETMFQGDKSVDIYKIEGVKDETEDRINGKAEDKRIVYYYLIDRNSIKMHPAEIPEELATVFSRQR